MPYEKALGAPAAAVLGVIALLAVSALALALRQLLVNRRNGNGNGYHWDERRICVIETEIRELRVAKHDHSTKIGEALLLAHRMDRRMNRMEQDEP